MRIAISFRLIQDGPLEGIPRYLWETATRIIASHPENEYFLFYDRRPKSFHLTGENITNVVIGLPARLPILWTLWFEYFVPFYLKKYKIDAFYTGENFGSTKTSVPNIIVVHDLAFLHFPEYQKQSHVSYQKKMVPKVLDKAAKILTVSEFTKNDILKNYQIIKPIIIAPNALPPIPSQTFKDLNNGVPYILYLGSIHPRKNILTLVKAFNLLKEKIDTPLQLAIVGRNAWHNNELLTTIQKSKYKRDILMPGMVSEEDKNNWLHYAKVFVYISKFEGFGIPILEAFYHNIPVITSEKSSMSEVAAEAAIQVNPNVPSETSDALFNLLFTEKSTDEIIIKSQKRLENYSWESTSQKVYTAIKSTQK